MGFKANDPGLKKMAEAGALIDQRTGRPLGEPVPARIDGGEQSPPPPADPLVGMTLDARKYFNEVNTDSIVVNAIHYGEPLGKQRPRMNRKTGAVYTPGKTKSHQKSLASLIPPHVVASGPCGDWSFGIRAIFFVGSYQRKDVDNMMKSVLDAMNRIIYADDSQVREVMGWATVDHQLPRTEYVVYRIHPLVRDTGNCEQCGAAFRRYSSWTSRRFCSRTCLSIGTSKMVEVNCCVCSRVILRRPADVTPDKKFYCTRRCLLSVDRRVEVPCTHCGSIVSRPKSFIKPGQINIYCSVACRGKTPPVNTIDPDRRSEMSRKGWETRRRNKNG